MTTTPDTRPLADRLTEHTTHLRSKRLPTADDRTSLQLLEELGLERSQQRPPSCTAVLRPRRPE